MKLNRNQNAFTLVEVLIASTISLIVVSGALWLLVFGIKNSLINAASIQNDLTQIGLNSQVWVDARKASSLSIYRDLNAANIGPARQTTGNAIVFVNSTQQGANTTYNGLTVYLYDTTDRILKLSSVPQGELTNTNALFHEFVISNIPAVNNHFRTIASNLSPLVDGLDIFSCEINASKSAQLNAKIKNSSFAANIYQPTKNVQATFLIR